MSCPTNTRGFIDARNIVERIKSHEKANVVPPLLEQVLCILRLDIGSLHPDDRQTIISELLQQGSEFSNACAYALGSDVSLGKNRSLWAAAAAIRDQAAENEVFIKHFGASGPDTGKPASYNTWVEDHSSDSFTFYELRVDVTPKPGKKVYLEDLTMLFHQELHSQYGFQNSSHFQESKGLVKWGSTIWPSNLEPYFRCGATEINIGWAEAQWHVQSFFEPLFDSSVPLKPMAVLLLVAGISTSETGLRGTATEIFIQTIDDGRYSHDDFTQVMAKLMISGLIVVSRWTKVFKALASISQKHENAVRKLIQSLLSFHPDQSPRELGGLIELLYELCIAADQPPTEPCAIQFFHDNTKGGKQKTFSRKLLKMLK